MEEDISFLEELAGAGLETITAEAQTIPYLSMVQPDSSAAVEGGATVGVWRNSTTGDEYGHVVDVVVLAFKTIWNERESQSPFATVGRYEPHGIPVTIQQSKNGKGYPKMINPETGNEVQELFVYAVLLPEHPEAGVLLFNPTVSSMRTCKQWNTQIKGQLLPNGAQAPIFGFKWSLVAELVDNPQKKGAKLTRLAKALKGSILSRELFNAHVKRQLDTVKQQVLAITSNIDDEAIEG